MTEQITDKLILHKNLPMSLKWLIMSRHQEYSSKKGALDQSRFHTHNNRHYIPFGSNKTPEGYRFWNTLLLNIKVGDYHIYYKDYPKELSSTTYQMKEGVYYTIMNPAIDSKRKYVPYVVIKIEGEYYKLGEVNHTKHSSITPKIFVHKKIGTIMSSSVRLSTQLEINLFKQIKINGDRRK